MTNLMFVSAGVLSMTLVFSFWAFLRPSAAPPRRPSPTPQRGAGPGLPRHETPRPPPEQAPPQAKPEPLPPELIAFRWAHETELEASRRDSLVAAIRGIPRPPRSMQQLLSPEFVAKAGSAELSELVMGEPLIAARVLATVNAPFYGLHKPVTSIGQAVTFLGINTVRSICLQYMLADAFKPKLAEAQRSFDAIWRASAIASELCVRLGKALNLRDQGALSTQVVLSFVGHLATASLIPAPGLEHWLARNRLDRARLEQELLGLSASEVGGLLMKTWELPSGLIEEVSDIGRQLVMAAPTSDPVRAPRVALAYLCARLGERLALGQIDDLDDYDLSTDTEVDTHHLRTALAHPALARLGQALASSEVQTAVQNMMGTAPQPA